MMRSILRVRYLLAIVTLFVCVLAFANTSYASAESDQARDQAKELLQDKKYGKEESKPLSEQAKQLGRWLGENDRPKPRPSDDKIEEQTQEEVQPPPLTPPAATGLSVFAQILLWLFIAILVGVLGYLVFLVVKSGAFKRNKKKKEMQTDEDLELLDIDWRDEEKTLEEITDAEILEMLSEKAEQEGHYDLALRYRFRAGLLKLNDMDVINFHPSITNAQWQLAINNRVFDSLTKDFNDVTYGEQKCESNLLTKARRDWSELVDRTKTKEN